MNLAALATPQDYLKLMYLRRAFADLVQSLDTLDFPEQARKEARPILVAASNADIYDGEFEGIVRQQYAFTGDFQRVWFTLDALTVMPLDAHTHANKRRAKELVHHLASSLIREVDTSHFPAEVAPMLTNMMDVVCVVSDLRLGAHKAVLASRSPVLANVLCDDTSGVLPFIDDDPEAVKLLLQCLYTRADIPMNTTDDYSRACKLAAVAHKYAITYPCMLDMVTEAFDATFARIQTSIMAKTSQVHKIHMFSEIVHIVNESERIKDILPGVHSQAIDVVFLGNARWLPIFSESLSKETAVSILNRLIVGGPQCGYPMDALRYRFNGIIPLMQHVPILVVPAVTNHTVPLLNATRSLTMITVSLNDEYNTHKAYVRGTLTMTCTSEHELPHSKTVTFETCLCAGESAALSSMSFGLPHLNDMTACTVHLDFTCTLIRLYIEVV